MKNNGKKSKGIGVVGFLVLVVGVSIGFAALSQTLKITGSTTIGKPNWKVSMANYQKDAKTTISDANITTEPTMSANTTSTEFAVKLPKTGDKYVFTFDVVNDGDLDAVIDSEATSLYTISGLSRDDAKYLDVSVTWADGSEITADNSLVGKNHGTRTVKVVVENNPVVNEDDPLFDADQTVSVAINLPFVQKH